VAARLSTSTVKMHVRHITINHALAGLSQPCSTLPTVVLGMLLARLNATATKLAMTKLITLRMDAETRESKHRILDSCP